MFIDFETVELGPFEWDLAHLDEEVTASIPPTSTRTCCERAASRSVPPLDVVLGGIDRGADMRTHAEQHLEAVRRALA